MHGGVWVGRQGGRGAYTRQVGEEQTRQEAPMGECVLSVLVHVWAVGPCNLAGGRRALALEVHLLLVSLLGSILFVPLLM